MDSGDERPLHMIAPKGRGFVTVGAAGNLQIWDHKIGGDESKQFSLGQSLPTGLPPDRTYVGLSVSPVDDHIAVRNRKRRREEEEAVTRTAHVTLHCALSSAHCTSDVPNLNTFLC